MPHNASHLTLYLTPKNPKAMKITPQTSFAQLESAQRQAHEAAVLRAQAQTEAARELLAAATERGHGRLDFWREALEHAEAEEARARRAFANWQRRDHAAARRAFDFSRALSSRTVAHVAQMEQEENSRAQCQGAAQGGAR